MKTDRRSIEKSDEQLNSEDQSHCYSPITSSKQNRMKLMKGNMLQSDDAMVLIMRV